MQGIWLEASDGTDVNSCCRSGQGDVIATADDYGMVLPYINFQRCVVKERERVTYHIGIPRHMSHVMNVRFLCNDTH